MNVRRIKIYGERNTGTNFVEDLLAANLPLTICAGNLPSPIRKMYKLAYKVLPYDIAYRLVEDDRDRRYAQRFAAELGWKHARIPNGPEGQAYPDDVGFIALMKDPYAWLLSLHKRPYQSKLNNHLHRISFSEFLRAPWRTVGREHGPAEYPNPVELWNDKVSSYAQLAEHGPAMLVRYEEVIEDINGFVHRVAESFGSELPTQVSVPTKSTKNDGRSTADIVAFYKDRSWVSKLCATDIEFINSQLDHDLARRCGYQVI
ncbi:hypothetical protein [Roseinatronobacter sp. S2]|uniref:hypothetical protein n=1 Tax=Roseinatronobacter sp. S2 TaxID=3035471 RepID=UPI00240EA951|nr:hypothetical protein [Roseinatronobacter sp. S2]WFE76671.1 hypothetical protein P8S53_19350 [Roseinatronobacter sp. S2]